MDKKVIQIKVSVTDWERMDAFAKSQGFASIAAWGRVALLKILRESQASTAA